MLLLSTPRSAIYTPSVWYSQSATYLDCYNLSVVRFSVHCVVELLFSIVLGPLELGVVHLAHRGAGKLIWLAADQVTGDDGSHHPLPGQARIGPHSPGVKQAGSAEMWSN